MKYNIYLIGYKKLVQTRITTILTILILNFVYIKFNSSNNGGNVWWAIRMWEKFFDLNAKS